MGPLPRPEVHARKFQNQGDYCAAGIAVCGVFLNTYAVLCSTGNYRRVLRESIVKAGMFDCRTVETQRVPRPEVQAPRVLDIFLLRRGCWPR